MGSCLWDSLVLALTPFPQTAGLSEQWNGLLKSVSQRVSGRPPSGMLFYVVFVLSSSGKVVPGKQKRKWGEAVTLTIFPNESLSKHFFPSL